MERTVIHEARGKPALYLATCLGFVAIFLFVPSARDDWRGVFGLVLFGLGALVFGWRLIRPGTWCSTAKASPAPICSAVNAAPCGAASARSFCFDCRAAAR